MDIPRNIISILEKMRSAAEKNNVAEVKRLNEFITGYLDVLRANGSSLSAPEYVVVDTVRSMCLMAVHKEHVDRRTEFLASVASNFSRLHQ